MLSDVVLFFAQRPHQYLLLVQYLSFYVFQSESEDWVRNEWRSAAFDWRTAWWETRPLESESPITGVKASPRQYHLSVFTATRLSQHGLCGSTDLFCCCLFEDIERHRTHGHIPTHCRRGKLGKCLQTWKSVTDGQTVLNISTVTFTAKLLFPGTRSTMNILGRCCLWFYMFLCNIKGQCVWLESPSWPERCWRSTAISGANRYASSPSSSSTSPLAALFSFILASLVILPPLAPLEAVVTHLYPKVGAAQVVGALPLMVWGS